MATTLTRLDDNASLTFDATPRVSFSQTAQITTHPVESGSDVSDNSRANQLSIRLVGIVTETPLGTVASTGGAAAVIAARDFLNSSLLEGRLLKLTCRLGVFTNLLVGGLPHDLTVQRSLTFNLDLKQVRIASSQSVTIDVSSPVDETSSGGEDYSAGFADEDDSGEQATTSPPDPAVTDDTSVLHDIVTYLGG